MISIKFIKNNFQPFCSNLIYIGIFMVNQLAVWMIQAIHVLLILVILIVPFTNSNYLLLLYVTMTPFLLLHWISNNDRCILTEFEKFIRGVKNVQDEEECFTVRLINPVYNFKENHKNFSLYIYSIVIGLWLLCVFKLSFKYYHGQIQHIGDLTKF